MSIFKYRVRDRHGKLETGTIEALDEEAAAKILTSKNLVVVGLIPKDEGFSIKNIKEFLKSYSGISLKQLAIFTRQFAVMVDSGMAIVESLKTLSEEEN